MIDKRSLLRWAERGGELVLTAALAALVAYGVWFAATRRASERHFRQAVAAGDYRIVEILGPERDRIRPFTGRILQVIVEPLPYDPAQMEIVCILWRGQVSAAQLVRGRQTVARQTTRALGFRRLCTDIAAALAREAP